MNDRRRTFQIAAGTLLLLAGSAILMGIIAAEAVYPATYTTRQNEISDLGATRPSDSVILQPSASIFDTLMIVTGILIIIAAYCLRRSSERSSASISLGLLGVGALGVGVFPGNVGSVHPIFALLAFTVGGLAATLAYRVTSGPFRYISVALGAVGLGTLVSYMLLGSDSFLGEMGDGGVERWVAYPIVLWTVAFGGYLLGGGDGPATQEA